MQLYTRHFPKVMNDNELTYFNHLTGIIDSIDELSTLEVTKTPNSYHFRLVPSIPQYNTHLLEEILKFHNLFKIKLDLSKSIKSSATINFQINL